MYENEPKEFSCFSGLIQPAEPKITNLRIVGKLIEKETLQYSLNYYGGYQGQHEARLHLLHTQFNF